MENIPQEIFLVIDPDSLEGIEVNDFKDHDGITWSDVRMNETDLRYVHESELATLRSQMQGRIDELKKYADHLDTCERYFDTDKCTCGLDELLKTVKIK